MSFAPVVQIVKRQLLNGWRRDPVARQRIDPTVSPPVPSLLQGKGDKDVLASSLQHLP